MRSREPVRRYIQDLERGRSAGDVAQIAILTETVAGLEGRVQELEEQLRGGRGGNTLRDPRYCLQPPAFFPALAERERGQRSTFRHRYSSIHCVSLFRFETRAVMSASSMPGQTGNRRRLSPDAPYGHASPA